MMRTGQPLMILSDLEKARERLGVTYFGGRRAKCFCGAPSSSEASPPVSWWP